MPREKFAFIASIVEAYHIITYEILREKKRFPKLFDLASTQLMG